jgi:HSP20 family protein
MTTLMRWDPFRELTTIRNMMDRLLEEPMNETDGGFSRQYNAFPLALDVIEDEEAYTVKASVPGVNPDDIEITMADNILTIKGEMHDEKDVEEKRYRLHERRFGSFQRSVTLPVTVDSENVEATHENGVLSLRLPKSEAVKPKKISVKKMIESN